MTPSQSAALIQACLEKNLLILGGSISCGYDGINSFPGMRDEPLYYRSLQNQNTDALKIALSNLDGCSSP